MMTLTAQDRRLLISLEHLALCTLSDEQRRFVTDCATRIYRALVNPDPLTALRLIMLGAELAPESERQLRAAATVMERMREVLHLALERDATARAARMTS